MKYCTNITLLLSVLILSGCQDTTQTRMAATLDRNQKVVVDFWEAFSSSNFEVAMSLIDDEGTWWIQGSTDISGVYTKQQFTNLVNGIAESTENGIQVTFKEITAQGDRVAVEADSYGVLKDGKIYQNTYHLQHVVKDGKLTAVREYLDTSHAQEIFGGP